MQRRLVLSSLVLLAAACTGPSESLGVPPDAAPVELPAQQNEDLADAIGLHRFQSAFTTRERLVIRSAAEWATAWDKILGSLTPRPPVPSIDFATHMVLIAAMGPRGSGGYDVEVRAVLESQSRLYVRVRELSPGNSCGVTGAITSPVAAVIVPAHSGSVQFVEEALTYQC